NGYVSGGKVVGAFTNAGLRLFIGLTSVFTVNISLVLHGAYVVCDIVPTDAGKWGFTMENCTLAGRWVADDLVKQLSRFPDPFDLMNPKPLCIGTTSYSIFKEAICNLRDITQDLTPPTVPCDSLSFAAKYDTRPALLGDL